MTSKTYTITVEVPDALVVWLQRRLGISEAKARVMVRRALRVRTCLLMHSAEVVDAQGDDPLVVFAPSWERAPREGERWFDISRGRARKMADGRVQDDNEEDSDDPEIK